MTATLKMRATLKATAARLVLLRAADAGKVEYHPPAMGCPAVSRHGRRTVTAAMALMEAYRWVKRGQPVGRGIHAPSRYELTAAGRVVLDAHPEGTT